MQTFCALRRIGRHGGRRRRAAARSAGRTVAGGIWPAVSFETSRFELARWVTGEDAELAKFLAAYPSSTAADLDGRRSIWRPRPSRCATSRSAGRRLPSRTSKTTNAPRSCYPAVVRNEAGIAMVKILPVIMCGGFGHARLAGSRESLPKQFIPLLGTRSTFQTALEMLGDRDLFESAIVITNHDYRFLAAEQVKETGVEADIVLEPSRRDSARPSRSAGNRRPARPETVVRRLRGRPCDREPRRLPVLLPALAAQAAPPAPSSPSASSRRGPHRLRLIFGPARAARHGEGVRRLDASSRSPMPRRRRATSNEGYLLELRQLRVPGRRDEGRARALRSGARARRGRRRRRRQARPRHLVLDDEGLRPGAEDRIDYAVMESTEHAAVMRPTWAGPTSALGRPVSGVERAGPRRQRHPRLRPRDRRQQQPQSAPTRC